MDSDRVGDDPKTVTDIAYKNILKEPMDESEYEAARRTLDSWSSWLQERVINTKNRINTISVQR
jgi:hypothetical protein